MTTFENEMARLNITIKIAKPLSIRLAEDIAADRRAADAIRRKNK